jgi:hypothetical protein
MEEEGFVDLPTQDSDKQNKKKKSGGFQSMNLIPHVFKAIMQKVKLI